jgi:hypothetical protein
VARQQHHKIEVVVEDEFLHMGSDLQQQAGDHLAWVYPILDGLVRQQQVLEVVVHYRGNSDCVRQLGEGDCCDDLRLVQGGFGSARECLLLRRSRDRG